MRLGVCVAGLALILACKDETKVSPSTEPAPAGVSGVMGYPDTQSPVQYDKAFWWELRPSAILLVLSKDAADCAAATPDPHIEHSADRLSVTMVERWRSNEDAVWQVLGAKVYQGYAQELTSFTLPLLRRKEPLSGRVSFDYHGKEDASFTLAGSFTAQPCGKAPAKVKPVAQRGLVLMVNGVSIPIYGARLDDGASILLSTEGMDCSTRQLAETTLGVQHAVQASKLLIYGDRFESEQEGKGKMVSGLDVVESGDPTIQIDWDVTTSEGVHLEAKGSVKALACERGRPVAPLPPPPPSPASGAAPTTSNAPAAGSAPKAH